MSSPSTHKKLSPDGLDINISTELYFSLVKENNDLMKGIEDLKKEDLSDEKFRQMLKSYEKQHQSNLEFIEYLKKQKDAIAKCENPECNAFLMPNALCKMCAKKCKLCEDLSYYQNDDAGYEMSYCSMCL
jgi:hypothetical protein